MSAELAAGEGIEKASLPQLAFSCFGIRAACLQQNPAGAGVASDLHECCGGLSQTQSVQRPSLKASFMTIPRDVQYLGRSFTFTVT